MKKENAYYGAYHQSGVIPYRDHRKHGLELLLITSRNSKKWIFPKGIVESRLSPQDSAAKEAYEEAGIRGKIDPELFGSFTYKKWDGTCRVLLYLMQVKKELKSWPENDFRKRQWFPFEIAKELVNPKPVQKLLYTLPEALNTEIHKND